ncbi:Hpt domain-containing protein [Pseudarthrobacter sulfonivorans]|uniref:Hpt domain-containing protein n=1 Tax=Pseudarthrobacter sulfonivorans TaxID=121292 RepID=UPI002858AE11|nr:Hpt domain-containing protein [Pseudarthrobacter sulfonivorans]MDR6413609.1 HPt (histidine-containing phosphotransfer) domain-containing protein [Pseudarthrobacter sulfonivorans]
MDSPPLTSSSGGVPAGPVAAGSAGSVGPGMPTAGGEPARWVEPEILAELEAELDGPELARGFARDYAALWDQRFSRLEAAVRAEDRPAALDAVISLRITSAMVGGIRLAVLAQALEDAVRKDDFVQGHKLLAGLAEHGVRTVSELQANYIHKD